MRSLSPVLILHNRVMHIFLVQAIRLILCLCELNILLPAYVIHIPPFSYSLLLLLFVIIYAIYGYQCEFVPNPYLMIILLVYEGLFFSSPFLYSLYQSWNFNFLFWMRLRMGMSFFVCFRMETLQRFLSYIAIAFIFFAVAFRFVLVGLYSDDKDALYIGYQAAGPWLAHELLCCAVFRMLIHLRKSLAYTNECAHTNSRTMLLFRLVSFFFFYIIGFTK